jgi:hypothetical protein
MAGESGSVAAAPSSATAVFLHDIWNLVALGALNAVHILWWLGLLSESALFAVFSLDVAYIALDGAWLLLSPSCVPRRVWATLVAHHAAVLLCVPVAVGNPLLMRHLLRTWVVELHSWNHIAARTPWPLGPACLRVNKALFVATRLVGFPLTYAVYHRERQAAPAASPPHLHWPLTAAQLALYGLMLHWGRGVLLGRPPKRAE